MTTAFGYGRGIPLPDPVLGGLDEHVAELRVYADDESNWEEDRAKAASIARAMAQPIYVLTGRVV